MNEALLWIVPGRRAVVRATLSYRALILAWRDELARCGAAIRRWYGGIGEADYDDALGEIDDWAAAFFRDGHAVNVPRDGAGDADEATVDTRVPHFKARLWKGPLRVLREADGVDVESRESIHDPLVTERPRLVLSERRREVENPDAPFLMGDVIELPLWKILGLSGREDYGRPPAYDDVFGFNPDGSYLLNTSLTREGGSAVPLHDNLVAMRFQLLLGCLLGSFYHGRPVFVSEPRAVVAAVDDPSCAPVSAVHARGMIYAATLFSAAHHGNYKGPEAWHFFTGSWCRRASASPARCLPTRAGLNNLPRDQPVTPGSVCSDTTLLLLNYMIRNHGLTGASRWGKGSVGASMRARGEGTTYAIHGHYQYWSAAEVEAVEGLVPSVPRGSRLAKLRAFLDALESVHARYGAPADAWSAVAGAHVSTPDWQTVSRAVRASIEQTRGATAHGWGPPAALLGALYGAMSAKKPVGYESLARLHRGLMRVSEDFIVDLEGLLARGDWPWFADVGPDFFDDVALKARKDARRDEVRRCADRPTDGALSHQVRYALSRLFTLLKKKREAVKKLAEHPEQILDVRGGWADMSAHLRAVNNVSLNGHEWAVVRLREHERLLDSSELPTGGYLAAFHPLSGEPYVGPGDVDGQCYVFEQGSTLDRVGDTEDTRRSFMGAAPFRWHKVPRNAFVFWYEGGKVFFRERRDGYSKQLLSITRLVDDARLAALHEADPRAFRPLVVHPTTRPFDTSRLSAYERARKRMVGSALRMHASRALPFPTLDESRGGFADHAEVVAQLDALGR